MGVTSKVYVTNFCLENLKISIFFIFFIFFFLGGGGGIVDVPDIFWGKQ